MANTYPWQKEYKPSEAVTNAQNALQLHQQNKPAAYESQRQQAMDDLMSQYNSRGKFQYDVNSDAMYQQMLDRYVGQGQQAMMDTVGQVSSLTGGYGNSYAQTAGQQTYQNYLLGAYDKMPQYYQMALDRYNAEGNDLLSRYGLLSDQEKSEYSRYQDQMNQYFAEQDRLQKAYDDERALDYGRYQDEQSLGYQMSQDSFNRMYTMIAQYGYNPSDEELSEAGMNRAQANSILSQWTAAHTPAAPQYVYVQSKNDKGSGDKNGTSDKGKDGTSDYTYEQVINALMAGGMNSTAAIQTVRNGGMENALKLMGLK